MARTIRLLEKIIIKIVIGWRWSYFVPQKPTKGSPVALLRQLSSLKQKPGFTVPETESPPNALTLKELARLFRRVWPYLKPQWKHLIVWMCLSILISVLMMIGFLSIFDIFNNKVLIGEPLDSTQAAVLLLDSSYVDTETGLSLTWS